MSSHEFANLMVKIGEVLLVREVSFLSWLRLLMRSSMKVGSSSFERTETVLQVVVNRSASCMVCVKASTADSGMMGSQSTRRWEKEVSRGQ